MFSRMLTEDSKDTILELARFLMYISFQLQFKFLWSRNLEQAVRIRTCIREVLCSNLGRCTGNIDRHSSQISSVAPGKPPNINRTRPVSSIASPIHYSLSSIYTQILIALVSFNWLLHVPYSTVISASVYCYKRKLIVSFLVCTLLQL